MGLSLLAPFFLAGLSLLAVPWLVHQIRRPEREPIAFSSLMFVPKIKKEVIERRRIQHILLMLLRMLLLALLVLAFSRPYWSKILLPTLDRQAVWHVVLLDNSYSMGVDDRFTQAKDLARETLNALGENDRAAFAAFAGSPALLASLQDAEDSNAQTKRKALEQLEETELTNETTNYPAALRLAQDHLLETGNLEKQPDKMKVHVITDLAKNGYSQDSSIWKISPKIELNVIPVGKPDFNNFAVNDIHIAPKASGELKITARVKNGTQNSGSIEVTLYIDGIARASNRIVLQPNNASNTSFLLPGSSSTRLEGWIEVPDDDLKTDNRRYFTYNPAKKHPLMILTGSTTQKQYPAKWFAASALQADTYAPWTASETTLPDLDAGDLQSDTAPNLLLVSDLDEIGESTAQAILEYANNGGQVILIPNETVDTASWNKNLLAPLGLEIQSTRFESANPAQFVMLSWIDFEHPVFSSLQGARFNDFSHIRFYNHYRINAQNPETARAIARFEPVADSEGDPAMIDCPYGNGKFIVWAFDLNLSWTNLPKSIKFFPIFFETLVYCSPDEITTRKYFIADRLDAIPYPLEDGEWSVQHGEMQAAALFKPENETALTEPGVIRWFTSGENNEPVYAEAVNVNAGESEPETVSAQEFLLKFSTPAALERDTLLVKTEDENKIVESETLLKREFGWHFLWCLLALLVVESIYASRLTQ